MTDEQKVDLWAAITLAGGCTLASSLFAFDGAVLGAGFFGVAAVFWGAVSIVRWRWPR